MMVLVIELVHATSSGHSKVNQLVTVQSFYVKFKTFKTLYDLSNT